MASDPLWAGIRMSVTIKRDHWSRTHRADRVGVLLSEVSIAEGEMAKTHGRAPTTAGDNDHCALELGTSTPQIQCLRDKGIAELSCGRRLAVDLADVQQQHVVWSTAGISVHGAREQQQAHRERFLLPSNQV